MRFITLLKSKQQPVELARNPWTFRLELSYIVFELKLFNIQEKSELQNRIKPLGLTWHSVIFNGIIILVQLDV